MPFFDFDPLSSEGSLSIVVSFKPLQRTSLTHFLVWDSDRGRQKTYVFLFCFHYYSFSLTFPFTGLIFFDKMKLLDNTVSSCHTTVGQIRFFWNFNQFL